MTSYRWRVMDVLLRSHSDLCCNSAVKAAVLLQLNINLLCCWLKRTESSKKEKWATRELTDLFFPPLWHRTELFYESFCVSECCRGSAQFLDLEVRSAFTRAGFSLSPFKALKEEEEGVFISVFKFISSPASDVLTLSYITELWC